MKGETIMNLSTKMYIIKHILKWATNPSTVYKIVILKKKRRKKEEIAIKKNIPKPCTIYLDNILFTYNTGRTDNDCRIPEPHNLWG